MDRRSTSHARRAALLGAAVAALAAGAPAAHAADLVWHSPGVRTFTPPPGTAEMVLDAWGGEGGDIAQADAGESWPGGYGAHVKVRVPVSPGTSYTATVGGGGTYVDFWNPGYCIDPAGVGGIGGGGDGGAAYHAADRPCHHGAGGGGATSVVETGNPFDLALVVAGGGGGASYLAAGGNAGIARGDDGARVSIADQAATGGTQTSGGLPGIFSVAFQPTSWGATAGGHGAGGKGGSTGEEAWGGGGGGWWGGGGGAGSGGAGGSSYAPLGLMLTGVGTYGPGDHLPLGADSGSLEVTFIAARAPVIDAPTAPIPATAGEQFSRSFVGGGLPAPTATLSGSLPPGMTLSGDGTISGRSTVAGTYTFDLLLTNRVGADARQVTIVVGAAAPATIAAAPALTLAPGTSSTADVTATVRDAFGNPVPDAGVSFDAGGAGTWGTSSLPTTLVLTGANGVASAGRLVAGATAGSYTGRATLLSGSGAAAPFPVTVAAPAPRTTIAGVSRTEGSTGTKAFGFVVTLSRAASTPFTVRWTTAAGTATAGTDFVSGSGTLTIPAGGTTGTITVAVRGDRTREADETFRVALSRPTGGTLATTTATGTIRNDD